MQVPPDEKTKKETLEHEKGTLVESIFGVVYYEFSLRELLREQPIVEQHWLPRGWFRSICQCARCSNQENDMIYIEIHDEWYCVECHDNDRIWYPAHGSAENKWQYDYINMYYEMKDKFEKKYSNKGKKNSQD